MIKFHRPSRATKTFVHLLPTILLVACASVPAADEPGETVAVDDLAGELISQVKFELQLSQVVLLNPYLEADSPRVDEFDAAWNDLTGAADAMVVYSVGVVELAQQEKADQDVGAAVTLLRELVESLNRLPSVARNLSTTDVDGILQDAANQKDLTKALRAAAPVTNAVGAALRQTVIDASDLFDLAVEETYDKVIAEDQPLMDYIDRLVERRNAALFGLLLLDRARDGEADAWTELLESNPDVSAAVANNDQISRSSISEAEDILIDQLSKVAEIWSYVKPSYDEFQAVLQELHAVEDDAQKMLKLAKLIAENWDKAQRQMAKGKPNAFAAVASNLLQLAIKRASRR